MRPRRETLRNLIALELLVWAPSTLVAGQKAGPFTAGFEFGCAEPLVLPSPIHAFLEDRIRRQGRLGVANWLDRAVLWDLNGDQTPEYFVPYDCGTNGNCVWVLFEGKELRYLGELEASRAYVLTARSGRWPPIEVCLRAEAKGLWIATYNFHRFGYERGTWQPMAGTMASGPLHRYLASRPEIQCRDPAPSP